MAIDFVNTAANVTLFFFVLRFLYSHLNPSGDFAKAFAWLFH